MFGIKWNLAEFTEHRIFVPPALDVKKCPVRLLKLYRFRIARYFLGVLMRWFRNIAWLSLQLRYTLSDFSKLYFERFESDFKVNRVHVNESPFRK